MIWPTGLPTLEGAGSLVWLWTFVGVLSLPVLSGTLLSWICIASLSLLLVLLSTKMGVLGLHCTLPFGLRVVWLRATLGSVFLRGSLLGSFGPPGLLEMLVSLVGLVLRLADADVGFWPFSVGLLVKLCSFLASLHSPSTVDDLGVGGVSLVEFLILYER